MIVEISPLHVAHGLPDVETNVLLVFTDGHTCEGFLDMDTDGTPVWRDVTAMPVQGVMAWAEMPVFEVA